MLVTVSRLAAGLTACVVTILNPEFIKFKSYQHQVRHQMSCVFCVFCVFCVNWFSYDFTPDQMISHHSGILVYWYILAHRGQIFCHWDAYILIEGNPGGLNQSCERVGARAELEPWFTPRQCY